jgi:hypothetical protein
MHGIPKHTAKYPVVFIANSHRNLSGRCSGEFKVEKVQLWHLRNLCRSKWGSSGGLDNMIEVSVLQTIKTRNLWSGNGECKFRDEWNWLHVQGGHLHQIRFSKSAGPKNHWNYAEISGRLLIKPIRTEVKFMFRTGRDSGLVNYECWYQTERLARRGRAWRGVVSEWLTPHLTCNELENVVWRYAGGRISDTP